MPTEPGTTGQTLTYHQIEDLWIRNGGDRGWAPLMAAIAMAESGGITNNLNNNGSTGDYSVGLWQINYFGAMGGPRSRKYGDPAKLASSPDLQAKAALDLFGNNGSGLTNWTNDAAWNAWRRAGAPQKPSDATVLSWGVVKGGNQALGPGPADSGFSPANGGSSTGTVALNSPGAAEVAIMCKSDNGISLPLVGGNFFNGCQVKGLIGGLLVGFGGAVLLGGLILIAGKTKTGQQIVSGVTSVAGGPAGAVAGAVRRRSTSAAPEVEEATISAPAPAPRTQVERSAEGRARLSPDVLADARRRRVEAGLQSA